MSRHKATISNGSKTDHQGVLGYDPPLRTFFLQAFPDPETDMCALWLGTLLEEFPSLESIVNAARDEGYDIYDLSGDVILSLIKESSKPTPPSLGEQLGIVR